MKKPSKKQAAIGLAVVIVAAGLAVFLHTRSTHKAQQTSGTVPTSKQSPARPKPKTSNSKAQGSAGTPSESAKSQGSSATGTASADLIAPFGTFVSNHMPGQNGSPTTEQSVCNTTPGATCDIQFTSGGVTKNLGPQVADSSGTAYWSWDVSGSTLAPGSWKITAVVKLNGQSKTASDPTPLEIQ